MRGSVYTLFSGSGGNSVLFQCGNTALLIDAGKNRKAVVDALERVGCPTEEIRAIVVTHEHSDHISALPVFVRKCPVPVHCLAASCCEPALDSLSPECLVPHEDPFSVSVGEGEERITVETAPSSHDSRSSRCCRISFAGHTVALATDTGKITKSMRSFLLGADSVILEANHDEDLLLMGPYPYELKRRILSGRGHLSNASAAEFAVELVREGAKRILLAHLSRENNTPELARMTVTAALQEAGYRIPEDCSIGIADPFAPTELLSF